MQPLLWIAVIAVLGFAIWRSRRPPSTMGAGAVAPDFELASQTGQPVRLYDLLERGPVVLYFYIRDFSPG